MSSVNFNIRIDENLKERAFPIIESYGLTPAQAFRLFLNQIAETRSVPLSFDYQSERTPNAATQAAMREAISQRNQNHKSYTNLNEMMKDIQEWQA